MPGTSVFLSDASVIRLPCSALGPPSAAAHTCRLSQPPSSGGRIGFTISAIPSCSFSCSSRRCLTGKTQLWRHEARRRLPRNNSAGEVWDVEAGEVQAGEAAPPLDRVLTLKRWHRSISVYSRKGDGLGFVPTVCQPCQPWRADGRALQEVEEEDEEEDVDSDEDDEAWLAHPNSRVRICAFTFTCESCASACPQLDTGFR
jgi:hypothetical protein